MRYRWSAALILFCAVILALAAELRAQVDSLWQVIPDINALDDYNVTPNSPALAKALEDASQYVLRWQLPRDQRAWQERRQVVEVSFRKAIGLEKLPPRTPLYARIVSSHDFGDYTLDNVIFYSRPDFPVTANLYRPKASTPGKQPAVLCPIGHALDRGKADSDIQARCIELTRLGFVVLVYDAIGHGERALPGNSHHEAGFALLPLGETVAGWMVWDSMRGIDYLLSLPEVDPERIGITGNSGGGLNCLFTAALDERIKCTALAGFVFQFSSWMRYGGAHCTCVALPGLYREMEWFEIAGLIAPRALLMLQGTADDIFPISSARLAGRQTEALYALDGDGGKAKFTPIEGYPHGYSRPFREQMYGWMLRFLMDRGSGEPYPENGVEPLAENDPRLLCDPDGSVLKSAKTMVQLAREAAEKVFEKLPAGGSKEIRKIAQSYVTALAAPPDREPHHLMPLVRERSSQGKAVLEKIYFLSEIGQPIPGLLWLPDSVAGAKPPRRTVLIVDERGKAAVAASNLVEPLLAHGFAVLSVDLRGRGETLGRIGNTRDNNYHLLWHSILWGRPIAGRRAFDLIRALDFVESRKDLSSEGLTVVGIGDESLPVLLAAAADKRISRVVASDYLSSFLSAMVTAKAASRPEYLKIWNSMAMNWGKIEGAGLRVDLGTVLPGVLEIGDLPDLAALIAPRPLVFFRIRDGGSAGVFQQVKRFQSVLAAADPAKPGWAKFYPDRVLDPAMLISLIESD